ncbi:hypothetical protein K0M31_014300 [Melipona bicolor]|uniref:Uncharacterized protein n=1 Tax=Melipona bicolor TaxID=60889 RepID=A0AA40KU68_9HYME|nr:hypothetical protein K0M31_014300 [Melipona bicolor]
MLGPHWAWLKLEWVTRNFRTGYSAFGSIWPIAGAAIVTGAKKNRVERSRVVDYFRSGGPKIDTDGEERRSGAGARILRLPLALRSDSCIIILDMTLIFREMSPFSGKIGLITSDLEGEVGEDVDCFRSKKEHLADDHVETRGSLNLALNFC